MYVSGFILGIIFEDPILSIILHVVYSYIQEQSSSIELFKCFFGALLAMFCFYAETPVPEKHSKLGLQYIVPRLIAICFELFLIKDLQYFFVPILLFCYYIIAFDLNLIYLNIYAVIVVIKMTFETYNVPENITNYFLTSMILGLLLCFFYKGDKKQKTELIKQE